MLAICGSTRITAVDSRVSWHRIDTEKKAFSTPGTARMNSVKVRHVFSLTLLVQLGLINVAHALLFIYLLLLYYGKSLNLFTY